MSGGIIKLKNLIRKFRGDHHGVAAIEFAIVFPILLIIYIGALEVSVAIGLNKRVARASSTIADILTQSGSTNPIMLDGMKFVAESMLGPAAVKNGIKLKIAALKIDQSGAVKVQWSWQQDGSAAYSKGSSIAVPAELKIPNSFLLRTELSTNHNLFLFLLGNSGTGLRTIHMSKTYYLRQRTGDGVTCPLCPS